MLKRIERIKQIIKLFANLEVSRRNLKKKFFSFYLYQIRIQIIRPFKLKLQFRKGGFVSTNLETYGYCNRKCDFCFNNERFDQREKGVMKVETWRKIIDELAEMDFCGRISPHFYGEPLLDKRLPEMLNYARKKCPNSLIHLYTNGDLLTEESLKLLISNGVDRFLITNYDDDTNELFNHLAVKYPGYVMVRSYRDFEKTDRTGEIYGRNKSLVSPCHRPQAQLVINWKGEVVLCCMDYYAREIFGNVEDQSISQIRNSRKFREYCDLLLKGKRVDIPICEHCDDVGVIPW